MKAPTVTCISGVILALYFFSYTVFAREYHYMGIDPVMHITMPVWRVDDTPTNRFLMDVFTPLRLLLHNDHVEWM